MASNPVVVVVQLLAKDGHVDEIKREATALFTRIRAEEEACDSISGHQDVDDPRRFLFYEEWRDRDEFLAFRDDRPYMGEYFKRMDQHVEQGEFGLWERFA